MVYEIEALAPGVTEIALLGERGRFAPFGVAGGGSGAMNTFHWDGQDGPQTPAMASKVVGVSLRQGARLRLESPGGGGWGDPLARPVEQVARDIRLGHVSAAMAVRDYGVTIAADGTVSR